MCRVITRSPYACCLFTQLTHCCLMFSRSQTGPDGGLESLSLTQTVTHLSTMPLSESVGGWWFVPKPVVVNMQASGYDTLQRWRLYQSSLCDWYPSLFLPQNPQKSLRRSISVFLQILAMITIKVYACERCHSPCLQAAGWITRLNLCYPVSEPHPTHPPISSLSMSFAIASLCLSLSTVQTHSSVCHHPHSS